MNSCSLSTSSVFLFHSVNIPNRSNPQDLRLLPVARVIVGSVFRHIPGLYTVSKQRTKKRKIHQGIFRNLHTVMIRSYVGIIQIRYKGRNSEFPLSLLHKLPCSIYCYQYRKCFQKSQSVLFYFFTYFYKFLFFKSSTRISYSGAARKLVINTNSSSGLLWAARSPIFQ